jgi:predicted RNA methylase
LLILLVTLVLLVFLLSMVWPPDSPWSPFWRTDSRRSRLICKFAKIRSKDIVYDLGSGDGRILMIAVNEFKAKKAVGVEIDPLRVIVSRLLILFNGQNKKIKIIRKNFFQAEISDATIVFMYLVPKALERLKSKLINELKPGSRVVTFVYKIDLPIIKQDLKNEIYLYEIPKSKSLLIKNKKRIT